MEPAPAWTDLEYALDRADRIARVSEAWDRVAREAGASSLDEARVVGTSLWHHLTDAPTRHVWQVIVERVRSTGRGVMVPVRCDTPTHRRWICIDVSTDRDQVVFRTRLDRLEERAPAALLDTTAPHDAARTVRMCSWCKRLALPEGRWVEVEEAAEPLGLLDTDPPPEITHGICEPCTENLGAML